MGKLCCVFCGSEVTDYNDTLHASVHYHCPLCGEYRASYVFLAETKKGELSSQDLAEIREYIKVSQTVLTFKTGDLEKIFLHNQVGGNILETSKL